MRWFEDHQPEYADVIEHCVTGAGLGASHQTGWTGLVADLIASGRARHRASGA